eukprot:TRINITY_DN1881_c0_g2_i5.p1 TRINITY_DN1881_c0_g2~~TRINITY_DN1881_c0_g2_i5.p1  ORF type:complete len:399 (-),score=84.09 TRINITY_DN1881_c0_g2_i5:204-1400(-)
MQKKLASYQGEFGTNWFQGSGVYVDTQGCIFDGEWDEQLRVGYGTYTDKEGNSRFIGWRSVGAHIKIDDQWGIWDDLSSSDWDRIMADSLEQHFSPNQYLISEDELDTAECIIRTKTGEVSVHKSIPGYPGKCHIFSTDKPGIIFGWASLLRGVGAASADIIAETDVTIDVVLNTNLWGLFLSDPGLFMRFFRHMADNQVKLFMMIFEYCDSTGVGPDDFRQLWEDRYGSDTSLRQQWPQEDRDGEMEMRQQDWDLILSKHTLVTYGKGDFIYEEGEEREIKLFQILDGVVEIIRTVGDVPQVVASHVVGEIVGESSFIRNFNMGTNYSVASAGLRVASDRLVAASISVQWLRFLFVHLPDLGGRFFAYLCTILAKRLDVQNIKKLKASLLVINQQSN